ncbi:hypothetical protein ACROYT_G042544 [Oculina patagonica]
MASNIWRPVDFEDDQAQSTRVQEEPPKKKARRCKVIEAEEEIVLLSYQMFSTAGWEAVLENVKELVREPMSGNALKVNKVKDYYQQASSRAALKRMQRITASPSHCVFISKPNTKDVGDHQANQNPLFQEVR